MYEKSPKPVIEWCAQTTPQLTAYKDGGYSQPDNLLAALKSGKAIMNDAQRTAWASKSVSNTAFGNLITLKTYLANQFQGNVTYLMDWQNDAIKIQVSELNMKTESILEFFEDFACSLDKVLITYKDIGNIKEAADIVETFVTVYHNFDHLRDEVVQSVGNLIETCNDYRQKHE